MKASEYLWKYCETMEELEGASPEQVRGETNLRAGYPSFEADTTGEALDEQDAYSLFGRNEKELWEAFGEGDRERFGAIVAGQQASDDRYHAEKAEAQEEQEAQEEPEEDCPVSAAPGAEG